MDTINVPAISTETVAKINAFTRKVTIKDGDVEKKVDRFFIAINDQPATALENISFGGATSIIRTAEKLYGIDAVDVCVAECLGCAAKITVEDEYVTNIVIDTVDAKAVKDALLFFKELNA